MWDKLKQLSQLQSMKKEIEKQEVIQQEQGVKVKVNGILNILEISVAEDVSMNNNELAQLIKKLLNKAFKEVNALTAKKMMGRM